MRVLKIVNVCKNCGWWCVGIACVFGACASLVCAVVPPCFAAAASAGGSCWSFFFFFLKSFMVEDVMVACNN